MKKALIVVLILVLGPAFSNSVMAEEITIVGTGDGVAILKAIGEAFSQKNPGVTIIVPKSIGSGGGIKSVGKDLYKIGRVARRIKDKEKHLDLKYVPYAKVPTVFFANKSVGVKNLSTNQVCDIYSGKITNWKDVGGKDAKIRVHRREDGDSSLRSLLKSFPGFKDITITSKSKTAYKTADMISVIEDKKGTIGFGPYDVVKRANVDVFTIDEKKPTEANYPSAGTLGLIFKAKNYTGNIKNFVEFATSAAALDAIKGAGGMPKWD